MDIITESLSVLLEQIDVSPNTIITAHGSKKREEYVENLLRAAKIDTFDGDKSRFNKQIDEALIKLIDFLSRALSKHKSSRDEQDEILNEYQDGHINDVINTIAFRHLISIDIIKSYYEEAAKKATYPYELLAAPYEYILDNASKDYFETRYKIIRNRSKKFKPFNIDAEFLKNDVFPALKDDADKNNDTVLIKLATYCMQMTDKQIKKLNKTFAKLSLFLSVVSDRCGIYVIEYLQDTKEIQDTINSDKEFTLTKEDIKIIRNKIRDSIAYSAEVTLFIFKVMLAIRLVALPKMKNMVKK